MADADRELARLWRVSRTAHEMVRDRGYAVADYELEETLDEFRTKHGQGLTVDRGNMSFQADHESLPATKIYVYFCAERNVSKASIKTFINAMDRQDAKRGILIYAEKLSSVARKAIQELQQGGFVLEEFPESDLLVNITKHFLVPKHQIMSKADKAALLKKYRLKDTQLPRIMATDPVARYYGMKRGEVMKIERASETAGRYITYRICL